MNRVCAAGQPYHSNLLGVRYVYEPKEHKGGPIDHTPLQNYDHDAEKFFDAATLGGGEFVDMSKKRQRGRGGKRARRAKSTSTSTGKKKSVGQATRKRSRGSGGGGGDGPTTRKRRRKG